MNKQIRRNNRWWPALALVAWFLVPMSAAGGELVEGEKARQLVAEGARLIDVRTEDEFSQRRLEGAENIPVQELPSRLEELQPNEEPIVLYCATGNRSANAAEMLKNAGFSEVYDLQHMGRW